SVAHGGPKLSYRQGQQWVSYTTLFVTQQGFPWGRSIISQGQGGSAAASAGAASTGQFADPARLASLAVLYAQLASSDPVRNIMLREGPLTGTIEADAILSRSGLADA